VTHRRILFAAIVSIAAVHTMPAAAQSPAETDAAALAKKLSNPVAALISLPFQFNYDTGYGPDEEGSKFLLNFQPVVPITLNEKWNIISRTILPVVSQSDLFPGAGDQSGIGDIVQSAFFSARAPASSGWIWGAGPVFLLPSGSDDLLTADKWGMGPTAVVLKQEGPWTYGALVNHIWSFAGEDSRADVNSTFVQPFVAYGTKSAWTFSLNSETTIDWEAEDDGATIPLNGVVTKVTRLGSQLVSLGAGLRYWADAPENGPEGLGYRAVVTLLLPK
jgi:hypothetical protein